MPEEVDEEAAEEENYDAEHIDFQLIGACNDAVKRGIKGRCVSTCSQDRDSLHGYPVISTKWR